MSDLYEEFLSRRAGADPEDGAPSPARDLALAGLFEREMGEGGPARFLWKCFPRWEKIVDAAERAYRAMDARKQLAALPAVRAVLRENAPLCAKRLALAKNEEAPGQAFEVWQESAEERMALPTEGLFFPDEPDLAARRLAYLEANRGTLLA